MTSTPLTLLVQGYLNLDWPDDYPSMWAAVDDFIESEPRAAGVLDEIDDVLKRMPSENDRRRYVLDDLDSGYLPDADGYTMTSWLEALKDHVRDRL